MRQKSGPKVRTIETRFWKKVEKTDDANSCWLWTGAVKGLKNRDGKRYGNFYWDGGYKHPNCVGAHIASYRLNVGKVPEGKDVLHTCDNPPCVRPSHLFLGTAQTNVDDMIAKERDCPRFVEHPFIGSEHPEAKLNEKNVQEIKCLLPVCKDTELAERYEVSPAAIWMIRKGRTWRHVTQT